MTNLLDACVDEIALEGLDGTSLTTLWERLELRQPPIGLDVNDKHVRKYLWDGIARYRGVSFYHVRSPWKNPVVRAKLEPDEMANGVYVVDDKGRETENHPLLLIKDGVIRGSCSTYRRRDDVTDAVRHGDVIMSLHDVQKRYGDQLVLVGSQNARERALFGPVNQSTIKSEVSDPEYLLVERVGRSRRAGEIPMMEVADGDIGIRTDKKTQFYHRKRMVKNGYLVTQPFVYYAAPLNKVKSTCIMFLPRFKRDVSNRMVEQLHRLGDILEKSEHKMEVYATLRNRMEVSIKLFKQMLSYHKYFTIEFHPVSMFYTPADEADKQRVDYCKDGRIRTVRCVKLVKHPRDCTDDMEEDDETAEDNLPAVTTSCYNRTVSHEAYAKLVAAGPEGLSISQFQQVFGVDNKSARAIVRSLCRSGYVFYYIMDSHRQRLMKIVARCYENSCPMKKWTDSERGGLEKLIKNEPKEEIEDESEVEPTPRKKRKLDPNAALEAEESMEVEEVDMTTDDVIVNQITKHTDVKDIFSYSRSSRLVSAKYLARARYILEAVKEQQVVEHVYRLRKEIAESERDDGHAAVIDPKVMQRLILSLEETGQLRSVKSIVQVGDREKKIHILCDPSVDPTTDSRVQAVFDKAKLELTKRAGDKNEPTNVGEPKQFKKTNKSKIPPNMYYDIKLARKYGALPKMKQIETLHKFLYYCTYGYEGEYGPDDANKSLVFEQGPLEDARVYKDEYTFKRFVPPLPRRHGYEVDGWFLTGDVIWIMPLVTFCQLLNVCYDIPELMVLLADPVKKYVPMFRQDGALIEKLMWRRGHVFRTLKLLTSMCHMGLLSFGPAFMKEKDQVPCFLHRHASLADTTKSKPGYCMITKDLDYPKSLYTFTAYSDVDDYWNDLQFISMNTHLGALGRDSSQPEKFDYKQLLAERTAALKPHCDPKRPEEVVDVGEIPGDGRGAAGLDTTFFTHRKSNWTHGSLNPFSMKEHYKDPTSQQLMKQPISKLTQRKERSELAKAVAPKKTPTKRLKRAKSGKLTVVLPKQSSSRPDIYSTCQPSTSRDLGARGVPLLTGGASGARPSKEVYKSRGCTREQASKGIVFDKWDVSPKKKKSPIGKVKKGKSELKPRPFVQKKSRICPDKDMHEKKDVAALRRMRTMRVRWTTGEDNMLLWFKIGHLFLGYHEVIMSWPDLRDILNKHFPNVSMDKTSKACARRLLFMCRNTNTTRTINLLANQALHNEELVTKYSKWRVKNKDFIKADKFDQLITDLRTMLKSAPCTTKLPDTLEELHRDYVLECDQLFKPECTRHCDVITVQDVCESTLHSLIHSTVWLGDDRESRSVDLFKVYKQYPDELLNTVCRRMVNDRMISKTKVLKGSSQTCTLTSMKSYQLSQRYQYMLTQINHHPHTMFTCSLQPYRQLTRDFAQGVRPEIDCTDVDLVGQTINLVTYTALRKLIYTVNIPEHLIVVELGGEETLNPPPAQTQSDDEDDELITQLSRGKEKAPDSAPVESWNQSKETLKKDLKDMPMTHASRFLLSMARHEHFRSLQNTGMKQRLSSHDVLAVKPCEVRVRFKKSVKQQPSLIKPALAESILTNVEDAYSDEIDYSAFLTRCQSVTSYEECVAMDQLHKAVAERKHVGLTRHELVCLCPELVLLERRLGMLLTEKVVIKVGVTVDRYVSYAYIRPWLVHAYKSRPAGQSELVPKVNTSDDSVRLEAPPTGDTGGVATPVDQSETRVSTPSESASQWAAEVTPSTSQAESEEVSPKAGRRRSKRQQEREIAAQVKKPSRITERVRVLCRPWKYPEGPVNKAALQRFLEAIMLAVMAKPGISESALEEKFHPVLQPAQIRELVEMLTQIGCIRVHCFVKPESCSLFSPRQSVQYASYDDGRLAKSYVPSLDCIIRLGQMTEHINNFTSEQLETETEQQ